jgi:tetratricopeptide (TPR) repeat protein
VRRGRLVRTQVGTDLLNSCVCHEWTPVSPQACPSAADACGRTSAFPALKGAADEFWVSADERAALVLSATPTLLASAGRLRAPVDGLTWDRKSTRILGVRHHAHIDPLVRAGATTATAAEEVVAPMWLPVPLQWPTTTVPPVPPLAAQDRGRGDRRGGREWGNRCFSHFKARRYDAAEAACAQGLAIATDEAVRGAIFHSLGRISEARGDVDAALVYYRTSLALRPDEATEKRLERLRRRRTPG